MYISFGHQTIGAELQIFNLIIPRLEAGLAKTGRLIFQKIQSKKQMKYYLRHSKPDGAAETYIYSTAMHR